MATPISSWGDQGDGTYKNPILNADYSDPDAIRVGDDFYMVCSEIHYMGIPVLHSKDLVNWTIVGRVYRRLDISPDYDTITAYSRGSWAPSIRYHDGKFWVFFCTITEGLCVSTAADPAGPWSPVKVVQAAQGWEDPCPFWDDDGQAYLVRGAQGAGPIIIHKMSPDGYAILDDGMTVYTGPVAEGPKVHKRNGYYYIWIPEGGVEVGWQTVLRSRDIYGPYESKRVLEQGSTNINGPHQGAWVELANGESWFIHFQYVGHLGRICHLQPMTWQDDWPVIGVESDGNGVGEPVSQCKKPGFGRAYPITAPATSDSFDTPELGLQWAWNHNPHDDNWSLTERPGFFRIHAEQAEDIWKAPNMPTQKLMGNEGEATVTLDTTGMADGQRAGLCHFSDRYAWIGIIKAGDVCRVCVDNNGEITEGPVVSSPRITLKTIILPTGEATLSYSLDGEEFTQLGGAVPLTFGFWKGSVLGLFSFNTRAAEGIADFDDFQYRYDGPVGAYIR